MNKKTIALGMSGGVDSSVAAYLLQKQGHNVIGLTMRVSDPVKYPDAKKHGCFGANKEEDIVKAKKTAELLGIPHFIVDVSAEFEKEVIDYFQEEYLSGRTPNPCMICNLKIKFDFLLRKALESGIKFDYFATGHFVRLKQHPVTKRLAVHKAVFLPKDQSYFLALLSQEQLQKLIFPLAEYTKEEVREIARKANLPSAASAESQDFYGGPLKDLFPQIDTSGKIITTAGKEIGTHDGIYNYTIGKRRGLRHTTGEKLFVVDIEPETNNIIAGDETLLYKTELIIQQVNYMAIPLINDELHCKVRIRYHHEEADAVVTKIDNGRLKVVFHEPQRSITPGQYAVLYENDFVLAAGVIE